MRFFFILLLLWTLVLCSKSYYDILGVGKDADQRLIHRAFRKKAAKLHPDQNPSPNAEKEYVELNEAYQVLSDPEKKKNYDLYGTADPRNAAHQTYSSGGMPFSGGGNPFSGGMPFGGGRMPFGGSSQTTFCVNGVCSSGSGPSSGFGNIFDFLAGSAQQSSFDFPFGGGSRSPPKSPNPNQQKQKQKSSQKKPFQKKKP